MSGNENTKNKLLDTMRKTKEDSSAKPAEEANKPKKEETKAVVKKDAPVKKSQKKSSDPFQSARRVWPD